MHNFVTLGFKRSGGKPDLLYGTETSFQDQLQAVKELGKTSDDYEKVGVYLVSEIHSKRMGYTEAPTLTITAANKSVVYGANKPTFSATYSGFTDGDSINRNDLSGTLAYACDYSKGEDAGEYAITPSGRTSSKYNVVYVAGTLTVTKAPLTVKVTGTTAEVGENPTVSYEGFTAGDTEADLTGALTFTYKQEGVAVETPESGETYDVEISGLTSSNYEITFTGGQVTFN